MQHGEIPPYHITEFVGFGPTCPDQLTFQDADQLIAESLNAKEGDTAVIMKLITVDVVP